MSMDLDEYKPCCTRRCLLANCKTRNAGGCSCVCDLVDAIHNLEMVIEGTLVGQGCIYFPDSQKREDFLNRMSEDRRKEEESYRYVIAPEHLKKLKERLNALRLG
jgi:hypothetical protein